MASKGLYDFRSGSTDFGARDLATDISHIYILESMLYMSGISFDIHPMFVTAGLGT